jgi:hypothetical protein
MGAFAVAYAAAVPEAQGCSGPGAAAAIGRAELLGLALVLVSALLAGAAFFTLRQRSPRVTLALFTATVLHPGLWISARMGDCGQTRTLGAVAMTIVICALAVWGWVRRP